MLGQSAAVGTVAAEVVGLSGDSGSSAEGTLLGTPNEVAIFNGPRYRWKNRPHGGALVVGVRHPFSWSKQVASHFGGA
jgi:hypothetical protein